MNVTSRVKVNVYLSLYNTRLCIIEDEFRSITACGKKLLLSSGFFCIFCLMAAG